MIQYNTMGSLSEEYNCIIDQCKVTITVTKMENGDVSLEDSLKNFEKGIKLARTCQKSLKDAELKVKILLSEDDKELSDFEE